MNDQTKTESIAAQVFEDYNGWRNRETWACNRWISNDEMIYSMVKFNRENYCTDVDSLAAFIRRWFCNDAKHGASEGDPTLFDMLDDIGSLRRVDWNAIANVWFDN